MRIKNSSFEPRRLRKAVRRLEEMEQRLRGVQESTVPQVPAQSPGLLKRWWRMLFGG